MALSKLNNDSFADTAVHGRRNLLINGSMRVAQRGTSATSSGLQTVDRFFNTFGTVAITQTQDSTVPSGEGFSHSYKNECTTASSAAGAFFGISYHAEAQDIRNSGWDYTSSSSKITLSFYARSSVAGTYMASLRTDDGTQYNIASQYTLVADTWKRVELTFPGNSNLTINNDTGIGLKVFPMLELGSNYTAGSSFDTWTAHSSTTQSPDANILFHDTANATFFVTGVQLEVGDKATPFEHRSFGEELGLCKRYYVRHSGNIVFGVGQAYSTSQMIASVPLQVEMRAGPTLAHQNIYIRNSTGNSAAASALSISNQTKNFVELLGTRGGSGLTAGNAAQIRINTTSDYIDFDAEL